MKMSLAAAAALAVLFALAGCSGPTTPEAAVMNINEFTLTPTVVQAGAAVTMRVSVVNALHVWVTPAPGGLPERNEQGSGRFYGTFTVYPTTTTEYVCHADDGTTIKTKTATVTVN